MSTTSKNKLVKQVMDEAMNIDVVEAKKYKPHATEQLLTVDKIKKFLPKGSSAKVTQEIVDKLNSVDEDGLDKDLFHEQYLSYMHLIGPGISLEKLMNAIKFVTLMSLPKMTMEKAYTIVFPAKAKEIEDRGQSCSSFATMYSQTKAVVEVQKLNILPTHLMYRPLFQHGIKKLVDLSNGIGAKPDDYVSPKVQLDATLGYMDIIKPPEENSMELKIGVSDEAIQAQNNLADSLQAMAQAQLAKLKAGHSLAEVQKIGITYEARVEE